MVEILGGGSSGGKVTGHVLIFLCASDERQDPNSHMCLGCNGTTLMNQLMFILKGTAAEI